MRLDRDFSEFIECCIGRDVRFLIVGGYAVAAHGHPRLTKDLDVWVWPDPGNAQRVVEALGDFGFGAVGLTAEDFTQPGVVIQLGYPPKRIDLLTSADGVVFEESYASRMTVDIDGLAVPFIGVSQLLANKRAAGRPQDLADVAALERGDPPE